MTTIPNAGRGADLYAWHAEATLRGGAVAPFEAPESGKTLANSAQTAHRDLFYRQVWAGMDRREVDITPGLAFLVESDEFIVSAAVVAGLFTDAQAVHRFADAR